MVFLLNTVVFDKTTPSVECRQSPFNRDRMVMYAIQFIWEPPTVQDLLQSSMYPFYTSPLFKTRITKKHRVLGEVEYCADSE